MEDETPQRQPYPLNAEGDFYVENQICLACDAAPSEAPDLMAFNDDWHCYFKRQPQTSEELEQAINAVMASDVGAVRYAGSDPAILLRLPEDCCDYVERKCPRQPKV